MLNGSISLVVWLFIWQLIFFTFNDTFGAG